MNIVILKTDIPHVGLQRALCLIKGGHLEKFWIAFPGLVGKS